MFIAHLPLYLQDLSEYGIDPDGPVPQPDTADETANFTEVSNPLSEHDYAELQEQINPLLEDNAYGIEIYISTCSFVHARMQP